MATKKKAQYTAEELINISKDVLLKILNDEGTPASVRVQAAQQLAKIAREEKTEEPVQEESII